MRPPSTADRFVRVTAYLSDRDFGYDNWHARQFAAGTGPGGSRPAVLVLCRDEAEQREALAYLEQRAAEKEPA